MKQQVVLSAALMRAPASPMFIPSQCDDIFGEVQPIRSDERNEKAETGTTPSPASITANTKMNNRRISLYSLPNFQTLTIIYQHGTLSSSRL